MSNHVLDVDRDFAGAQPHQVSATLDNMKLKYRQILVAVGIGAIVTVVTTALSYWAQESGAEDLSHWLFWPNTVLQSFVPLHDIGTPDRPLFVATPLNFIAFLLSFPASVFIYSVAAYFILFRGGRS